MADAPDVLLALRTVLHAAAETQTDGDLAVFVGGVPPEVYFEGHCLVIGTPREGQPAVQTGTDASGWGAREQVTHSVQCDLALHSGGFEDDVERLLRMAGQCMQAMRAAIAADESLGIDAVSAQFDTASQWDPGRDDNGSVVLVGFAVDVTVTSTPA